MLQELTGLRADLNSQRLEAKAMNSNTQAKISESKADLIRWIVGVGLLQMALVSALVLKLLS